MTLPEPLRRAIRTFLQGAVGTFLLLVANAQIAPGTAPDIDWLRTAGTAALWGGAIATLTWLHNALEDAGAVPTVLKDRRHG